MNAANHRMELAGNTSFRRTKQALRMRLHVAQIAIDLAMLLLGFHLAAIFRGGVPLSPEGLNVGFVLVPVFAGVAINSNAYCIETLLRPAEGVRRALMSLLFAVLAVMFIAFLLQASLSISRTAFLGGSVLSAVLIVVGRYAFHKGTKRLVGGNPVDELMIVDGVSSYAAPGVTVCNASDLGLRPDLRDPLMLDQIGQAVRHFDRVVIACPADRYATWALLLKGANIRGEIVVPTLAEFGPLGVGEFHGQSTIAVSCGPLSLPRRVEKRALDLAITVPLLLFLAPFLAVVAIAVKLDSPGSVLFRQTRLGLGNRLFFVYKFRSMHADKCDAQGNVSTRRDDDRVTRVGKLIRATSIDELPQLFNVLLGNMSLVGPRPHALGSLAGEKLFWEVDERYWHRHAIKPGITGLAQVRGHRGATHQTEQLVARLEADLEYLKDWSVFRDVYILFATLRVLVHRNAF